jgi:hypothetical protein
MRRHRIYCSTLKPFFECNGYEQSLKGLEKLSQLQFITYVDA